MVLLQSEPLALLTKCPDFLLPSVVDDRMHSLVDFVQSKAFLVAFICNHCPYVRAIEDRLISLSKSYSAKDFLMAGICSNDAQQYPDDNTKNLKARWQEKDYGFPYLVDSEQTVAKAFGAVCTPDLFLFDHDRRLFYHGQLDDNWRDSTKVRKHDLKEAIEAIIMDKAPPKNQQPTIGCSIKWKTDTESN